MQILIRRATLEDRPELGRLIRESARSLSVGYYTPEQVEGAIRYVFGVDTQLIADGTYFAAEADRLLVGCGGWSKRRTLFGGDQMKEGADPLLDPSTDPARVRAFFVRPGWARRGVGRRLLEACEEAARLEGFRAVELAATLPGEPLYAAFGYEVLERFDIPLPDGQGLPIARMRKLI